jgi:hypothetical protein
LCAVANMLLPLLFNLYIHDNTKMSYCQEKSAEKNPALSMTYNFFTDRCLDIFLLVWHDRMHY